jgi:hypothetical protein
MMGTIFYGGQVCPLQGRDIYYLNGPISIKYKTRDGYFQVHILLHRKFFILPITWSWQDYTSITTIGLQAEREMYISALV